uniref:Uncharacterized protein n=1 Tax=Romanomermis culicivorax TaxID=13658 RepID=A0A915JMX2_ROMCU
MNKEPILLPGYRISRVRDITAEIFNGHGSVEIELYQINPFKVKGGHKIDKPTMIRLDVCELIVYISDVDLLKAAS